MGDLIRHDRGHLPPPPHAAARAAELLAEVVALLEGPPPAGPTLSLIAREVLQELVAAGDRGLKAATLVARTNRAASKVRKHLADLAGRGLLEHARPVYAITDAGRAALTAMDSAPPRPRGRRWGLIAARAALRHVRAGLATANSE